MKKLLFIYNPVSGKQLIQRHREDILQQMYQAGYEVDVRVTTEQEDADQILREMPDGYERVVVGGGDGTLHNAVQGICGRQIPLGYIPAGSTNDFGHSLGIQGTLSQLVDIALSDCIMDCDVGRMNDRHFLYVACFGTLSDVSYNASQEMKNKIGHAAYVVEGLRTFQGLETIPMVVTLDDQIVAEEFCYGMITNSKYVAGVRMNYAKDVSLNDGKFEVILIRKPHGPFDIGKVARDMIVPQEDPEMLLKVQTSHIHFHTETPIAWDLDGEYGGRYRDVDISVEQNALRIIHGDKEESQLVKLADMISRSQF